MTPSRKINALLWTLQALLAALFLFAGTMKWVSGLPPFMLFIGAAEILGAVGLVLPGIVGIRRGLTPLAAAGLTLIMGGAVVVTLQTGGGAGALVPLLVGGLTSYIAYARRPASRGAALARIQTVSAVH